MRTAAIAPLVGIVVASCSVQSDVDVESRRDSATPASTAPASGAGDVDPEPAPTTTSPDGPPDDMAPEPVRFILDEVIVDVSLRPTIATNTSGGPDGFTGAVELDDGSFVASGFDGPESEASALWRSDEAETWIRVGTEVGGSPGPQEIRDLVLDEGTITAFGVFLDATSTPPRIESVGRWVTDTSNDAWTTFRSLPATSANESMAVDGLVVTVGAERHDEPGGFAGVVTFWNGGVPTEVVHTDLDVSGGTVPGSEVFDIDVDPGDGSWLTAGLTTITDSGRTGDELAVDADVDGFASDVALWRSADAGRTWSAVRIPRFVDVPGAQRARELLRVQDRWWLLTEEDGSGSGSELRLHTSDDGVGWTPDPYRRQPRPGETETTSTAGLYLVDGLVIVIDETADDSKRSLLMTMIDPSTGASDRHDLTARLGGLESVEEVIEISDGVTGLGFGRVERGPGVSDLQVIEIRRSDRPPEPDDPTPSTTTPSGGGASDA